MDNDQRWGGAASRWGRDASSHDTKNKFNHRQVPEERERGPGVSTVVRGVRGAAGPGEGRGRSGGWDGKGKDHATLASLFFCWVVSDPRGWRASFLSSDSKCCSSSKKVPETPSGL
ncbi:unnamed protein product [Boreogadus saida]